MPVALRVTGRLAGHAALAAALLAFALLALGPRTGGYRTLTVLSGSMRPTIAEGSVVVVTPVTPNRIRVGDVVTYHSPTADRRVVTHRVVEIVEPGPRPAIRTKGDASGDADPWVARLQHGPAWRVRAALPHAGYAIHALGQPLGRRLTVLAAPAALVVWSLADIWRRRPDHEGQYEEPTPEPAPDPAPEPAPEPAPPPAPRSPSRRPHPAPPALAAWGVPSPTCGWTR